jgi:mycofactocin precursor
MNETHATDVTPEPTTEERELVAADDLVEEVSIDGMCGVY